MGPVGAFQILFGNRFLMWLLAKSAALISEAFLRLFPLIAQPLSPYRIIQSILACILLFLLLVFSYCCLLAMYAKKPCITTVSVGVYCLCYMPYSLYLTFLLIRTHYVLLQPCFLLHLCYSLHWDNSSD